MEEEDDSKTNIGPHKGQIEEENSLVVGGKIHPMEKYIQ